MKPNFFYRTNLRGGTRLFVLFSGLARESSLFAFNMIYPQGKKFLVQKMDIPDGIEPE